MTKQYRLEVETLWIHPEGKFSKRREMVYDFTTGDLIPDERTWADGQDFYDPKRTPHIYADWDKAELAYTDLDHVLEDWEPLDWMKGSDERIEAFRLIAIDEDGNPRKYRCFFFFVVRRSQVGWAVGRSGQGRRV